MSVNTDIREEGVRPILKTSRMSVYLSDTGIGQNTFDTKYVADNICTYIMTLGERGPNFQNTGDIDMSV